jgi:hypothetical protein
MDLHRRGWSKSKRENLTPRQLLVWMDFYSFFSLDQTQVHTLCFVLEWKKESGALCRKYVDVTYPKTNSANNFFIAAAWLALLEQTSLVLNHDDEKNPVPLFDAVFVCCDNAIVSASAPFPEGTTLQLLRTHCHRPDAWRPPPPASSRTKKKTVPSGWQKTFSGQGGVTVVMGTKGWPVFVESGGRARLANSASGRVIFVYCCRDDETLRSIYKKLAETRDLVSLERAIAFAKDANPVLKGAARDKKLKPQTLVAFPALLENEEDEGEAPPAKRQKTSNGPQNFEVPAEELPKHVKGQPVGTGAGKVAATNIIPTGG